MLIDGTGRIPRHKCNPPDPFVDDRLRHGTVWMCLGGRPVCGKYWRLNESNFKWEKLSPRNWAWWKHAL